MPVSPFAFAGGLLTNGIGVLFLSLLAAVIVLVWDWRWMLASATILLLGLSNVQAALHSVDWLVSAGQWLSIIVALLLLALASRAHPASANSHATSNWLMRLLALAFILGAWWVIDPGVSLPMFTQVESDLLFWVGLCGLLLVALSVIPLQAGTGLLLMLAPIQALAAVLLPGSGLSVIVGIGQVLLALGCAYLILMHRAPAPEPELLPARPAQMAAAPQQAQPSSPSRPASAQRLFGRAAVRRQTVSAPLQVESQPVVLEAETETPEEQES